MRIRAVELCDDLPVGLTRQEFLVPTDERLVHIDCFSDSIVFVRPRKLQAEVVELCVAQHN